MRTLTRWMLVTALAALALGSCTTEDIEICPSCPGQGMPFFPGQDGGFFFMPDTGPPFVPMVDGGLPNDDGSPVMTGDGGPGSD